MQKISKERFVIAHDLRVRRRQENIKDILSIYTDGRCLLQNEIIVYVLEYAGMLFLGKRSICWVQFV